MCGQDCASDVSTVDGWPIGGSTIGGTPVIDQVAAVGADRRASEAKSEHQARVNIAELTDRLRSAEDEVAQLRAALASQRLIGVAVGLLAHRFRCSPEQSWQLLVRLSQTSNVKIREISRILVDAHAGRGVAEDADVLAMLASQLPRDGREVWETVPRD